MHIDYNLRAVGVTPNRFPYVSVGDCMGLDCKRPGVQVIYCK
ncbi:unnamed protein product [Cylicostephanus goldi]|uniref:Uncharacterized protein n=1 Tax=Cylicostephanus goldi TaxID=71465 RepID=A0A3P7MTP6_CYLGO|nr:unnamed protein product [Cylicostephanus goldi]